MQDITGVWLLRAFQVENLDTGEVSEPFGPDPRGTMMFHHDGRMVALLTPGQRAAPSTDADRARAFQQLVACSGPYRLEPPNRFVIEVDIAWFEPWIGTEQVRTYTIDGDRMEIVSAPTRLPQPNGTDANVVADATVVARLAWLRAGAPEAPPDPAGRA